MKRIVKILLIPATALLIFYLYSIYFGSVAKNADVNEVSPGKIKSGWKTLSGGRTGKVVYADPPDMMILYLHTGERKKIKGIVTAGGPGRIRRGYTPRPSWSPDGSFFSYRHDGDIFISDEHGKRKMIRNPRMDTTKETRWSVVRLKNKYYLFGPAVDRKGILVSIDDPASLKEIFPYPVISKHAELTSDGKHIVYSDTKDIYSAKIPGEFPGNRISHGQSCRPCSSPRKYSAWLPAPHTRYYLHHMETGAFAMELKAPENEEIYRLNWSNLEEFAAHMYGSRGNTRMHVRKISDGRHLFIGYGWDPDLWVGEDQ